MIDALTDLTVCTEEQLGGDPGVLINTSCPWQSTAVHEQPITSPTSSYIHYFYFLVVPKPPKPMSAIMSGSPSPCASSCCFCSFSLCFFSCAYVAGEAQGGVGCRAATSER